MRLSAVSSQPSADGAPSARQLLCLDLIKTIAMARQRDPLADS